MSTPVNVEVYTQGTGTKSILFALSGNGAPAATLLANTFLGIAYIDKLANDVYFLTSYSSATGALRAVWTLTGGSSSSLNTLTDTAGTVVSPAAGNIQLSGTTNQVTMTAGSAKITASLPATVVAPGSITATTTLASGTTVTAGTAITATLGAITATNGNLVLGTAGNKIQSTSVATTTAAGANAFGTVVLVGGTATIGTTAVTANSIISCDCQTLGTVTVASTFDTTTRTPGTSFVLHASQGTDTSTVSWFIIN